MSGPILPTKVQDLLQFITEHAEEWDDAPTTIGLSAAQVTHLKTTLGLAQTAYDHQQSAITASRSATVKAKTLIADARAETADLIRFIKAFAQAQPNPDLIYSAADLPPPAAPSPAAPPAQAENFKAELTGDGFINLTWKAPVTASGAVVWLISRRIGMGPYVSVGVSGERAFTDETIPLGSSSVSYKVQGQRGQTLGDVSLPFTLQFGVDGDGFAITAQVSEKLAA